MLAGALAPLFFREVSCGAGRRRRRGRAFYNNGKLFAFAALVPGSVLAPDAGDPKPPILREPGPPTKSALAEIR